MMNLKLCGRLHFHMEMSLNWSMNWSMVSIRSMVCYISDFNGALTCRERCRRSLPDLSNSWIWDWLEYQKDQLLSHEIPMVQLIFNGSPSKVHGLKRGQTVLNAICSRKYVPQFVTSTRQLSRFWRNKVYMLATCMTESYLPWAVPRFLLVLLTDKQHKNWTHKAGRILFLSDSWSQRTFAAVNKMRKCGSCGIIFYSQQCLTEVSQLLDRLQNALQSWHNCVVISQSMARYDERVSYQFVEASNQTRWRLSILSDAAAHSPPAGRRPSCYKYPGLWVTELAICTKSDMRLIV